MDLTTLIGLILSGILIVYGIGTDALQNFVDVPSVIIVVGGTLAALIASYPSVSLRKFQSISKYYSEANNTVSRLW